MVRPAHDLSSRPRARAFALAAALAALIALALPALAAAATTWTVEGTGDAPLSEPGECETADEECTFRAAIEAANEHPDRDTIKFDTSFHGEGGPTLVLGSALPAITQPLRIDATPCEVGQGPPFPCVPVVAPAGSVGIDVAAGDTAVEGLIISGARTGIRLAGGAAGNKVEGNEIHTPSADSNAIAISVQNGPNQIYANVIEGSCCLAAIFLQGGAAVTGNKIGGDSTQSENVIDGFQNGAIAINLPETTRNEVGRNRGLGGGNFIGLFRANGAEPNLPNQIDPPAISNALQASVTGTAKAGAKVRLFRKATAESGEIEGFLGNTVADSGGNWKATFSKVPVGTLVAATQTLGGGTSQLTAPASIVANPPPDNGGGSGGGTVSGGGSSSGGAGQQGSPIPPTAPRAKIAAGPQGTITATTAKFRFSSTLAGSRFECRLDDGVFARCRSPRTYRHLKPGRHVFRVRAVGPGGLVGTAVKRAFVVS